MAYRYIPVVRTKAGEAEALDELSPAAKAKILPLVAMTRVVPATFLPKMIQRLAGLPIALSGVYNHSVTGSPLAFSTLFHGLGNGGIPVVPSVPVNGDPTYVAAVSAAVGQYAAGVVVTVQLADVNQAAAWVAARGWGPANVDLIVNVGEVSQHVVASFAGYVAHTLNAYAATMPAWRSVTLNASSAPQDASSLITGRNLVPRRDWQLWQAVYQQVSFGLDYSDFGHVHPSLEDVPGYAMANATVSVRYAIDADWIIRKGVQTSGQNGQPMPTQYRNHARALIAEPNFGGVPGCWGDTRIQHYATTTAGTGGRGQWAAVLLNRHLSLTASRLP